MEHLKGFPPSSFSSHWYKQIAPAQSSRAKIQSNALIITFPDSTGTYQFTYNIYVKLHLPVYFLALSLLEGFTVCMKDTETILQCISKRTKWQHFPIIYLSTSIVNTQHQIFYLYWTPVLVQQFFMEVLAHSNKHTVLKRTTLKEEAPTTTGHNKWLNKLALCGITAMLNS